MQTKSQIIVTCNRNHFGYKVLAIITINVSNNNADNNVGKAMNNRFHRLYNSCGCDVVGQNAYSSPQIKVSVARSISCLRSQKNANWTAYYSLTHRNYVCRFRLISLGSSVGDCTSLKTFVVKIFVFHKYFAPRKLPAIRYVAQLLSYNYSVCVLVNLSTGIEGSTIGTYLGRPPVT